MGLTQLRRHSNQGPRPEALAHTLQQHAPTESFTGLSTEQVTERLRQFGQGAERKARQVKRVLLGTGRVVDETLVNNHLQAMVAAARADGDYAELIEVSGAVVSATRPNTAARFTTAFVVAQLPGISSSPLTNRPIEIVCRLPSASPS